MYHFLIVLFCDLLNIPRDIGSIILAYAELNEMTGIIVRYYGDWAVASKIYRYFMRGVTFGTMKSFMADTCRKFEAQKAYALTHACGYDYIICEPGSKTTSQIAHALHVICSLIQNDDTVIIIRDKMASQVFTRILKLFNDKHIYYYHRTWGCRSYANTKFYVKRII
jgi:hypothetical protein